MCSRCLSFLRQCAWLRACNQQLCGDHLKLEVSPGDACMHNKCEHSDTHVMTTAQTTECVFAHTHREMDTHIHSNTLTNCKDNLYNYASQLALIFWQLTCICSWIKPIYTQHTFAHNTCAITLIHINSWGARNNHTHTHLHSHIQTDSKHKCSNNYNMFAFYKTIAHEIDAWA